MANEAQLTVTLAIRKGSLDYASRPTTFKVDVSEVGGPVVGQIAVPVTGVDIDLSGVTQPGLARIMNLDPTNYVMLGMKTGSDFLPMIEIGPGETYPLKLYRYLGEVFVGTGSASGTATLHIAANNAECKVLVEVFPK